jgi:peroxiredoxin
MADVITGAYELPQTMEGHYVLHDLYGVHWPFWLSQSGDERLAVLAEATAWLREQAGAGQMRSALYSMVGQKADLLLLHYRDNPEGINRTERSFRRLRLFSYLRPAGSYLSVIEASLAEANAVVLRRLAERSLIIGSSEYQAAFAAEMAKERKVLESRVLRFIPDQRYLCFYPMSKRRGETVNWYALPADERRALMRGHGKIGHRYHREVIQVVGGSIGLDDYEWGVTLHADDPLVIKRLITEMRFDPASSRYAEFGPFHFGIRQPGDDLSGLLQAAIA